MTKQRTKYRIASTALVAVLTVGLGLPPWMKISNPKKGPVQIQPTESHRKWIGFDGIRL